ncbi:hypothetical protein SESBI_29875 [Sesbania bispinosa]|nr:hypothetical protein SESBI_29875 [Sesbania bispinosa]
MAIWRSKTRFCALQALDNRHNCAGRETNSSTIVARLGTNINIARRGASWTAAWKSSKNARTSSRNVQISALCAKKVWNRNVTAAGGQQRGQWFSKGGRKRKGRRKVSNLGLQFSLLSSRFKFHHFILSNREKGKNSKKNPNPKKNRSAVAVQIHPPSRRNFTAPSAVAHRSSSSSQSSSSHQSIRTESSPHIPPSLSAPPFYSAFEQSCRRSAPSSVSYSGGVAGD